MWCVIADNGDENWVYGPFNSKQAALNFADEMESRFDDIKYNVGVFMTPDEGRESE